MLRMYTRELGIFKNTMQPNHTVKDASTQQWVPYIHTLNTYRFENSQSETQSSRCKQKQQEDRVEVPAVNGQSRQTEFSGL